MENSPAFNDFIKQSEAKGYAKLQGYNGNLFEKIYPSERKQVEEKIYELFMRDDSDISIFMPELQLYDGIKLLREKLNQCNVPSGASINYALSLFKAVNDKDAFEVLKINLQNSNWNNKIKILINIQLCSCNNDIYTLFEEISVNDENKMVRSCAIRGILYFRHLVDKPNDYEGARKYDNILVMFDDNNIDVRVKALKEINSLQSNY